MPVDEVPGDLDETIRQNTPRVDFTLEPVTDDMRDVMTRVLDPGVAEHELTFHERKVALFYGWMP